MHGRVAVVLAGLAGVLAACGGGASGATAGDGPATPPAPPAYAGRAAEPFGAPSTAAPASPAAPSTLVAASVPAEIRGTLPMPTVPTVSTVPTTPASTSTVEPPTTTSTTLLARVAPPASQAPAAGDPDPGVGLGAVALATDANQIIEIGRSREGRPIFAVERGTPGGVPVLVIGVIHGNEDAGVAIVEHLATAPVPPGVALWLIETMNPDGQAARQRGNAARVDLNRNFPLDWGPIGTPGDAQYAGTGPASEPETQAVVSFVSQIRPALGIWYHQDLYRLSPGEGFEGDLKRLYSARTGLPILDITGGRYTGVAAVWQRAATQGISFIVELGPGLSPDEADVHAAAVLELAAAVAAR